MASNLFYGNVHIMIGTKEGENMMTWNCGNKLYRSMTIAKFIYLKQPYLLVLERGEEKNGVGMHNTCCGYKDVLAKVFLVRTKLPYLLFYTNLSC